MLKVSASPTGADKNSKKQAKKAGGPSIPRGSTAQPPSTMFTSPLAPSSRRNNTKGKNRMVEVSDDDDFLASDESDAFEPVRPNATRKARRALPLGPPITTDGRLKNLPEPHQVSVHQFVDDAKKLEEKLRNRNGHSRPYFTENDFREMAINWTLTIEDMLQIPGINEDRVHRYGKSFLPLIEKYHNDYDEMMASNNDRDIDQNHQNVIDLCSDEDDDEYDEEDDDYMSQAEQPSKYFVSAQVEAFNAQVAQAAQLPQRSYPKPEAPKKPRGGSRGKGKGYKRGGRKSNDSASGSGSGFRGGRSNSGVSKRGGARRTSGGAKKGGTSTGYQSSNIMKSFGRFNGGGGGGMGGGIGMMPT